MLHHWTSDIFTVQILRFVFKCRTLFVNIIILTKFSQFKEFKPNKKYLIPVVYVSF